MFLLPFLALALGFIVFWSVAGVIPPASETFARYAAIALLAGLDTVLGGVRAWLSDTFDDAIFISGFFLNALLAVGLVVLGERLGLEAGFGESRISMMMIGAVVVFSGRILNNLAVLRRLVIERLRARRTPRVEKEKVTAGAQSRA
jgi:small basic protein